MGKDDSRMIFIMSSLNESQTTEQVVLIFIEKH